MSGPRRSSLLVGVGAALLASTVLLGPVFAAPAMTADAADATTERATLVGVQGYGSYHEGGYVASLANNSTTWRENSSETYFDVTRLENGSVVAGFMSGGFRSCGPYEPPCARTGYRVIDPDPTPRVVSEYSFPVRTRTNSEVHDVEVLPSGGVLLADMDRERVLHVEDGEVVWEWRASSYYEPPTDPTRTDWLHINDVDRIGEDRYLVSVRNANQLLVLDRDDGVVEVINEDGDPSVLDHQHNPQWLADGAVLVADSENHRVVELHRTDDGEWVPVWTLTAAGGSEFNWPRDADRLDNGTTLITDTRNARLLEVDRNGTVVWSRQFDYRTLPYEADRVPGNEPVGGVTYGGLVEGEPPEQPPDPGAGIPVLTPAYRLVTAAAPFPLWFEEPHLLSSVVGLGLVVVGAVVRVRE
jgi:hypothetical protein